VPEGILHHLGLVLERADLPPSMILFDAAKPGDLEKAEAFGADTLKACV
jgi:hypothetical protein